MYLVHHFSDQVEKSVQCNLNVLNYKVVLILQLRSTLLKVYDDQSMFNTGQHVAGVMWVWMAT